MPPPPATDPPQSAEELRIALQDARWAERAGLPERALAQYQKALALAPDATDVQNDLARLLLTLGRARDCLQLAQQVVFRRPDDPQANASIGEACLQLGDAEQAIPFLRKALALRPDQHRLRKQLAETLLGMGRRDDAVATFADVEPQYWNDIDALRTMGGFYHRAEAAARAERVYCHLLELDPDDDGAYRGLAQLYFDHTQVSRARDVALEGLRRRPDEPALMNTLALAQAGLGLVRDALATYRRITEVAPNMATSHSNMLLTMHYSDDADPGQIAEEHRRWGRLHAPPGLATREFANRADPGRRLRIGYLSPDFRRHSVAFFVEPLLEHRSREQFEVFCYGEVRSPDDVTQRIRQTTDHYRDISSMHDAQVADLIKADAIDILVDLAGHAGTSRTTLLGYKPAPVQVTYCGYPDTTGIAAVDYRITDALADPPGVENRYTETLCRLPGAFLCYRPPDERPETAQAPCEDGRPVTFGSFNREFKVSQQTYNMWSRILSAVPGSRLLMKSISGGDPGTRRLQLDEFARRGIPAERVDLVGFINRQTDHLAEYRKVDIALDTFPYHGTTTTLDALFMSVPVITLAGYNHASRVGVSLLTAVGLAEFIAGSPDDYVRLAVELARQPRRIAELHRTLRGRLLGSPLCDGPRFVRGYEYALRGMWCNWCRSRGADLSPAETAMAAFEFTGEVS